MSREFNEMVVREELLKAGPEGYDYIWLFLRSIEELAGWNMSVRDLYLAVEKADSPKLFS